MQRTSIFLALWFLALGSTARAEHCYSMGASQFAAASHVCVSTVLPSQGANSYDPVKLIDGSESTAWCEGASDTGHGQWIELRWSGPQYFKTLWIMNGYGKSNRSYYDNGRPALLRVHTADGLHADIPLYDQSSEQPIFLPRPVTTDFIRLTIIDVFEGAKYHDTCISDIWADLEELNHF